MAVCVCGSGIEGASRLQKNVFVGFFPQCGQPHVGNGDIPEIIPAHRELTI
jgi:hypothetical protein